MISGRQIRAARGLLNWDAITLAKKAGLTRETVSRIETDSVQPQEKSLASILRVFDENGVEFTQSSGVRLKQQEVEVLEGVAGYLALYRAIYQTLSTLGGVMLQSGVNEKLCKKYLGDHASPYLSDMSDLVKENEDVKVKILIEEGDYNFMASDYAEYRWLPKQYFSPSAFYVFGDNLALISFSNEPAPLIILIKSFSMAEAYRRSFEFLWANSKIPPKFKKPQTIKKKKR